MKKISVVPTLLAASLICALAGCSTKNYVRSQTTPIADKANQLDAEAGQNRRDIRDVDARSQSGIAGAQNAADAAGRRAAGAQTDADRAQQAANSSASNVAALGDTISNLDQYHSVASTDVLFATGKDELTSAGKRKLDSLGTMIASNPHYMLEVRGATDSTGGAELNYALSQRRAQNVVRYMATKYNVPPRNITLIGTGKDVEAASNHNSAGRAKNRRVEVKLLVRGADNAAPAPSTAG